MLKKVLKVVGIVAGGVGIVVTGIVIATKVIGKKHSRLSDEEVDDIVQTTTPDIPDCATLF